MRQALLAGLGLLAFMAPGTVWSGENLSGRALVIDGDTLNVRGKIIGLRGISAPGPQQSCLNAAGESYACGKASAKALATHIGSAVVTCETQGSDEHGRILAICRKGTEDLSAWMTAQGHATANRQASSAYVTDEKQAWAKRRGLWAGVFDDPSVRQRFSYSAVNQVVATQPDDRVTTTSALSPKKR